MALDMFINMGAKIKGESRDKVQGPKGDIDILAWSWGMSQSGSTHTGGGGGAGKANFQDLSFTKYIDSASAALLVTSVSTGGSGGEDRLTENVTLNFGEVKYDYTPQDSKGTVAGDKTFAWNIAENVAAG